MQKDSVELVCCTGKQAGLALPGRLPEGDADANAAVPADVCAVEVQRDPWFQSVLAVYPPAVLAGAA